MYICLIYAANFIVQRNYDCAHINKHAVIPLYSDILKCFLKFLYMCVGLFFTHPGVEYPSIVPLEWLAPWSTIYILYTQLLLILQLTFLPDFWYKKMNKSNLIKSNDPSF